MRKMIRNVVSYYESPGQGIFSKVKNETKLKTLEKERTDALEMAAQENEEREEKTCTEIKTIERFIYERFIPKYTNRPLLVDF